MTDEDTADKIINGLLFDCEHATGEVDHFDAWRTRIAAALAQVRKDERQRCLDVLAAEDKWILEEKWVRDPWAKVLLYCPDSEDTHDVIEGYFLPLDGEDVAHGYWCHDGDPIDPGPTHIKRWPTGPRE